MTPAGRGPVVVGELIQPWTMDRVDPARMKTMAAILRDPYPVHWDRDGNVGLGIGPRVINQGPLNVGYLANMLMAWAGPDAVRRLTVVFASRVLDEERVTAGGVVSAIEDVNGERQAVCEVWLERAGERVVTGTAVVSLGPALDVDPAGPPAHDSAS